MKTILTLTLVFLLSLSLGGATFADGINIIKVSYSASASQGAIPPHVPACEDSEQSSPVPVTIICPGAGPDNQTITKGSTGASSGFISIQSDAALAGFAKGSVVMDFSTSTPIMLSLTAFGNITTASASAMLTDLDNGSQVYHFQATGEHGPNGELFGTIMGVGIPTNPQCECFSFPLPDTHAVSLAGGKQYRLELDTDVIGGFDEAIVRIDYHVPEAPARDLLLPGLAMLGVMLRRRRQKASL